MHDTGSAFMTDRPHAYRPGNPQMLPRCNFIPLHKIPGTQNNYEYNFSAPTKAIAGLA